MGKILKVRKIYKYMDNDVLKYFVYLGDSNNSNDILAGEVGAADDARFYQSLKNMNMVLFIDHLLIVHPSTIIGELYIAGAVAEVEASLFQLLINNICISLLENYSKSMTLISNRNYDSANDILFDITFPEKMLRLLSWNEKKKELKFERINFLKNVFKYNIYFAYLGCNIGCEIEKLRPVLIWKEHINKENPSDNSYFVFPITSKIPKKRYYYNVELDINGEKNLVKINDGKRISTKRIIKPLRDNSTQKTIKIEEHKIQEIKEAINKYFSII